MKKTIPYGTKSSVPFTLDERELVQTHTFYDVSFGNMAVIQEGKIKVDLSLDDIEDLQGYIAAEANHTDDKKLQRKLDKLFDKLQYYMDKYDDQG